jgi:hypothetical protein
MDEPIPVVVENSFQIAWDYLDRAGELGDPNTAGRVLLTAINSMVRRGERRKLLVANRAIDAYRRFRAEHGDLAQAS